jgi:hypothetical protein
MLGLGGKSKTEKQAAAGPPKYTATMELTPRIPVRGLLKTPPGFMPIAGEPPLWLQNGSEIGLVGSLNGHTEILGFKGENYKSVRLIAADGGLGARNGRIVGLAASPDGMTLAIAEGEPGRVKIVLRYVLSSGGENTVVSFDGTFHAVSLEWIGSSELAVGLAAEPGSPPSVPAGATRPGAPAPAAAPAEAGGLFYIDVAGAVKTEQVKVGCPLSPLAFSRSGRFVVGEGDPQAAPMVFDRRTGACRALGVAGPLRVLGWAPGEAAFLYAAPASNVNGPGVFRYTLATGRTELIAVASGAAAYLNSGAIVALGNRALTYRGAMAAPNRVVTAELATFDPKEPQVQINSLGLPTTPQMLMASTMAYTPGFAQVAMQLYVAAPRGPVREIVTYSLLDRKAFVLAHGALHGTAVIGWSPKANRLAIFDGDAGAGMLAVIAPNR